MGGSKKLCGLAGCPETDLTRPGFRGAGDAESSLNTMGGGADHPVGLSDLLH